MNAGDLVDEVRETLGGGITEQINRLADDFLPGDSELSLQYDIQGVIPGVPMSVGLNCFQTWSVAQATKKVEVTARWAGSPEVAAPAGTVVRIKPNFYTHRILNAINQTLVELSSPLTGVLGVDTLQITYSDAQRVYDLAAAEDLVRVLRVNFGYINDEADLWSPVTSWQHRRVEPSTDFPSGDQLRILSDEVSSGSKLQVTFARAPQPLDTLDDDVTVTLLPDTAYDLPVLGAAYRLSIPQEFRRNLLNAQPDARRSAEVPPGASLGGARALLAMYQRRVEQEAARFMRNYPPMRQIL